MEIIVTPTGQFRVAGDDADAKQFADIFAASRTLGLIELVKRPALRSRSLSASYWHDYVSLFMRAFCAFSDTDPLQVPLDEGATSKQAQALPPMSGAEYVSQALLAELWHELEQGVQAETVAFAGSPRQYIAQEFPAWADVGKVHFHLAENRIPGGEPFAFLATYSVRIPGKARVQHRPLGVALKESVDQNQKKQWEQLLGPIHKASQSSAFVRDVLSNRGIYKPLYFGPEQAFRFIADIPFCEHAGVICKVPDWWQMGRPPKAKVTVQVGNKRKKSQVGFDQLLDFDVGVSIGGEALSPAQLKLLLEADGPLVELGGKWVEIDRQRIEQLLSHWHHAVAAAQEEGMTLAKAMRMLSGFGLAGDELSDDLADTEQKDWLDVVAGPAFTELVAQLRGTGERSDGEALANLLQTHLKGTLRPYQTKGLDWLKTVSSLQLGGCLADDMGLGKTIQVLALLLVQKYHFKSKRSSLLVVPASLLGNWQAEIAKFAPSLRYRVLHGSAADVAQPKGKAAELRGIDLVITTYGMVLRSPWVKDQHWQMIIADEAQAIKNARTKQSQAMRSLNAVSKIAMTGTPVENSLADLWSIFDFSCPGLLGSETQFKEAVKQMSSKGGGADYGPLRSLIAPYILRRKKTDKNVITDLPDKIEMLGTCYLTKKQATLYQKEVNRLEASLEEADGIHRKGLVLASLMKFKQICNHPSQYLGNDSYVPALSGKFEKLKELVETIAARQERVLVFTQFRELTDILAHYLGECFGREGLVLHGGTPVKKRQGLVETFQKPGGPPFFVLSIKAGGTGLNLTEASHVIHFDRWWNPAVENQATDRAFRIGQKKNVVVHKLVCKGTIEEKIDAMIAEKQSLADALIEGGKEVNLTELSDEDLMSLVRLDVQTLAGGS